MELRQQLALAYFQPHLSNDIRWLASEVLQWPRASEVPLHHTAASPLAAKHSTPRGSPLCIQLSFEPVSTNMFLP